MGGAGDPKPSKESLKEVRREFKQREKARRQGTPPAPAREASAGGAPARSLGQRAPRRRIAVPRALLAVVAAGCLGTTVVWFGLSSASNADSTTTPPLYPAGAGATTAPGTPAAPAAPAAPVDPFAGSPVAAWLVGTDAVVPPPAAPVGRFTAAQVADAYAKTRAYLVAAFLDPRVVYGGEIEPVAALLDAESARYLRTFAAAPDEEKANPTWYATRFHPGDVVSAAPGTRVNGSMTATVTAARPDLLEITYTYAVVYAVRPGQGGDTSLVSVRRSGTIWFQRSSAKAPGVRLTGTDSDGTLNTGGACDAPTQHPGFFDVYFERPAGLPTGPMASYNPLDLAAPLPDSCFRDTSGL